MNQSSEPIHCQTPECSNLKQCSEPVHAGLKAQSVGQNSKNFGVHCQTPECSVLKALCALTPHSDLKARSALIAHSETEYGNHTLSPPRVCGIAPLARINSALCSEMNINTLKHIILSRHHDIVYIAIGCALGRYKDNYPRQQFPSFLNDYMSVAVILIDPDLESPPRLYSDLSIPTESHNCEYVQTDSVTVIPMKKSFDFDNEQDNELLKLMYNICIQRKMKLIVQDYSGRDIRQYYPMYKLLYPHVLFDITYGDGGCFPDLDAVVIQKDEKGNFIQPALQKLSYIYRNVTKSVFDFEFKKRTTEITVYLQRYYRIIMSLEEQRDWCTQELIRPIIIKLGNIYNLPSDCTPKNIRNILIQSAIDIHSLGEEKYVLEDIERMVDECFNAYSNMIKVIKSLLAIN